jgi:D-serine deaminase-like pyridoxal phosphate-dependent protein
VSPIDPAGIETPIGYVDLERVRANAKNAADYARQHDLSWRPHIKTHKSLQIAQIQLDSGAQGLTVATLREAEVMSTLTNDILLAYPPVGAAKLERLTELPESVDLKVALDSASVLSGLAKACVDAGRTVGVLVEQDVGLGRVGLQSAGQVVELASLAQELDGVDFRGIMFYPGQIRMEEAEQRAPIADVAALLSETIGALQATGCPPEIVSGGSTPTLRRSHEMPGLTEIRAGSCIFFDREGLEASFADTGDIAYTVLATVVSTSVPGHAVVDAGSKALAKEGRGGDGFGLLFDRPEVRVSSMSEEHGVLDLSATDWVPEVGERVRIIPNHVCVSVNLQDELLAVDGEEHSILKLEGRGRGQWSS